MEQSLVVPILDVHMAFIVSLLTSECSVRASAGKFNCLRIGNRFGKQGCGNRPPIDDRNLIRKFSIDCLDAPKT